MVLGAYYLTYGPDADELGDAAGAAARAALAQERAAAPLPHAQEAELCYEAGVVKLHDLAEYRRGRDRGRPRAHDGRADHLQRPHRAGAARRRWASEFDPTTYEFVNQSMRKRDTVDASIDALVQRYGASGIVAGARRVQGPRVQVRDAGRHHDLQERRDHPAREGRDPREATRARSPRSRTSTTWA